MRARPTALSLLFAVVLCTAPGCDFGGVIAPDTGRGGSLDAAPPPPDADLDAPGLDAAVLPGDDAAFVPPDANGGVYDANLPVTPDARATADDAGPDAPRVSMPCVAAGACDPFVSDSCGAGMACRGGAMGGPTACAMTAATTRAIGEDCTASNQCVGGSACLDFGDGQRCQQLCPMGSLGACLAGSICTGTITGVDPCIQVCRPLPERCDIYAMDCADPMDTCTFATNSETGERYTGCRLAGTRTDGQPCGGGMGSCAHGLVCITEGGMSSCHFACNPEVMPTTCPAMQACTGLARSWMVGYCQPTP